MSAKKPVMTRGAWAEPGTSLAFKTGTWRVEAPFHLHSCAPCHGACPAGEDAQAWIARIQEHKLQAAWEELVAANPLPAITGRVCPHPCEASCNRGSFDEAIAIHDLERFIGDAAIKGDWPYPLLAGKHSRDERIAIVGAGPAGLSCAYQMIRRGFAVTVLDALPEAGGLARSVIPMTAPPRRVVHAELGRPLARGRGARGGDVLGRGGGALARMELPFKLGLGGRLGSGRQPFPWIHVDDVVGAILFALGHEKLSGPVNFAAPGAPTNAEFSKALGRALGRPAFLPAPAFALRELRFKVAGLSGPAPAPCSFDLAAAYGPNGTIDASGHAVASPLRLDGTVSLRRIPLAGFMPYVPKTVRLVVTGGDLDARMGVDLYQQATGLAGSYRGRLGVRHFSSIDAADRHKLLSWESLQFDQVQGALAPFALRIGQVSLSDYRARVIVDPDGRLNLQKLIGGPEKPASAASKSVATMACGRSSTTSRSSTRQTTATRRPLTHTGMAHELAHGIGTRGETPANRGVVTALSRRRHGFESRMRLSESQTTPHLAQPCGTFVTSGSPMRVACRPRCRPLRKEPATSRAVRFL